jgi:hypothetical protein
MDFRLAILVAGLLPLQMARSAPAPDAAEIQLSSRDRAQVSAAACGVAGGDAAELRASRAGKARLNVAVRCRPHGTQESLSLAHVTSCGNEGGRWKCEAGNDALMMKLGDTPEMALIAGGVPARDALYLVQEVDKLTVPPFHKPARQWLQDQCSLVQAGAAAFRGGTLFELQCTRGTLHVTRDCWKDRCRFFISRSAD